jgi:hypothetical protein
MVDLQRSVGVGETLDVFEYNFETLVNGYNKREGWSRVIHNRYNNH